MGDVPSSTNRTAFRRVARSYAIGLGLSLGWHGAAYLLGRHYAGVPTNILWHTFWISLWAVETHTGPDWSRSDVAYFSLPVCLLLGGLLLIWVVALTPFHWDQGRPSPWADVAMTSGFSAIAGLIRRDRDELSAAARSDEKP